jgi:hypothetical protein
MWESVEEAFGDIYRTILNTHSHAALAAYGTVVSGPARIEMIKAAAAVERMLVHEKLWNELNDLLNDFGKFAARRNEIAHGYVMEFQGSKNGEGHYLVPPDYNTRKRLSPRKLAKVSDIPFHKFNYAYTAVQIDRYCESFWDFLPKVEAWHDKLKESLRQRKEIEKRLHEHQAQQRESRG